MPNDTAYQIQDTEPEGSYGCDDMAQRDERAAKEWAHLTEWAAYRARLIYKKDRPPQRKLAGDMDMGLGSISAVLNRPDHYKMGVRVLLGILSSLRLSLREALDQAAQWTPPPEVPAMAPSKSLQDAIAHLRDDEKVTVSQYVLGRALLCLRDQGDKRVDGWMDYLRTLSEDAALGKQVGATEEVSAMTRIGRRGRRRASAAIKIAKPTSDK